jgi:PAS domain S-box-containing protein
MDSARILIVDDHPAIRSSVRVLLSSHPNLTICAEAVDGIDAIEKAKVFSPDVILMDISMPRMDGIEATRIIRRELSDVKVIIVSQNHPAIVSRQAAEVKAAAYVAKTDLSRCLVPTLQSVLYPERIGSDEPHLITPAVAEAPLRRSDFEDFAETAPVALHWVGADGTILWANQAELDMLGYTREEYIGHNISQFHVDSAALEDIMTRLTRNERLQQYEARLRCKDGSERIVLISSSVLFEDQKFIHTRCITVDVTERKQTDLSKGLLSAIVDSSDDAIVSKTLDSIITSWNKSEERIFGFTAEEAV